MSRLPNDTLRKTLEDIRVMVASNIPRSADSESSGPMSLAVPQSIESLPAPSLDVTFDEHQQQHPVVTAEAQQEAPEVVSFRVLGPRYKSADLSRKVSIVSKRAIIEGSLLVFYLGEWTSDGDRAALGCLRDQSPASQTHFKEQIEASLSVQDRNILRVFGHVTIESVVYSVNQWVSSGDIRGHMRRNPGADRMRLLGEVASGVEFLHSSGIVHGDLCAKNVLINSEGKAFVYGFDLSELSNPTSRVRWLAPEMIAPTRVPPPTEATDVWSFGSLCLEIFTGVDPYVSYPDVYVPVLLNKGTIPEHPGHIAIGLSPMMWELMQSCWKINPAERPPMAEVQSTIRRMLPYRVRESYATLLRVADTQMRRDNLKHAGYNLGVETSYAAEARSARLDREEEKQLILTPPREQALERS